MRRSLLALLSTAFTAVVVAACTESLSATDPVALARELPLPEGQITTGVPAWTRSVGLVPLIPDTLTLQVPTRIRRGQPLPADVTLSLGGCTGPDTTVVTVSGLTATVVPYVKQPTDLSLILCRAGYASVRVTSPVVFTQAGMARVRFVVRAGNDQTLRVVERRVQVTE